MNEKQIHEAILAIVEPLRLNWSDPVYDPSAPEKLICLFKLAQGEDFTEQLGDCLMFLGRLLEANCEYLGAARFYFLAKTTPKYNYVCAMEYLREVLRKPESIRGNVPPRSKFELIYRNDTVAKLISEYFPEA